MTAPLIHFSREPLRSVCSVEQSGHPDMKPQGLWVSCGNGVDSWPDWCRHSGFRLSCLIEATEVVLKPDARVLRISGSIEFDRFDETFGVKDRWVDVIGWRRVATEYQAIIIDPYLWSRRLGERCGWYYGWDCASGCIWDADAVAELRPISVAPNPVAEEAA